VNVLPRRERGTVPSMGLKTRKEKKGKVTKVIRTKNIAVNRGKEKKWSPSPKALRKKSRKKGKKKGLLRGRKKGRNGWRGSLGH